MARWLEPGWHDDCLVAPTRTARLAIDRLKRRRSKSAAVVGLASAGQLGALDVNRESVVARFVTIRKLPATKQDMSKPIKAC